MLVVFNGETLFVRWRGGRNYRYIKATMTDNPIARSVVRSTAKYYEIHPLNVIGLVVGVLFLLMAALKL